MTATCVRCHAPLEAGDRAAGMDRACLDHAGRVLASGGYSATQVARIAAALESGEVIETGTALYLIGSATENTTYTATAVSCTCQAGRYGRKCWHKGAARILDTTEVMR